MSPRKVIWDAIGWVIGSAIAYFLVSMFAYAWNHPERAQMQVFQETWRALTWQEPPEDPEKPDQPAR